EGRRQKAEGRRQKAEGRETLAYKQRPGRLIAPGFYLLPSTFYLLPSTFYLLPLLLILLPDQIAGFLRQPVEQMARFPEAPRVRLRAEDDDGDRVALRETKERRQAVAG